MFGSGGLFGSNTIPTTGGLFGSLPEGWANSGPAPKDDDEDDEDDNGEPLEAKSEGNPEESKYNYEY